MRFLRSNDEYEQVAPYYDTLLGPLLMPVRNEVCRIAGSRCFGSILDICCGTGQQSIMLARLGFRVSGVDLSPAMLEVARKKSPESIAYFQENAASLHFTDQSFDCAIISFALHEKNAQTRDAILREAQRVLRKGGKILVVDYLLPHDSASKLGHFFVSRIERIAGKNHHRHFSNYMERGALQALIKAHGMEMLGLKKFYLGTTGLLLAQW